MLKNARSPQAYAHAMPMAKVSRQRPIAQLSAPDKRFGQRNFLHDLHGAETTNGTRTGYATITRQLQYVVLDSLPPSSEARAA